ncbi:MAG: thioesterase family protein, partial [Actinomycetota bacterium]
MSFAQATSLKHRSDGTYTGAIAEGWDIVGNANGGYLLALAGRALGLATDRPDPVSVTAHYLSPGRPGPVTIDVETLRSGRRLATGRAVLHGRDAPLLAVLGTWGDLSDTEGPERVDARPVGLPPVEECEPVVATDTFPPPFMGKVELRLHPEDAGFATGARSGQPRVRGWFRLPGEEPVDTLALLMAVDAFPPTIFNADLPVAWTPTVEMTVHVRYRPAPGWLR